MNKWRKYSYVIYGISVVVVVILVLLFLRTEKTSNKETLANKVSPLPLTTVTTRSNVINAGLAFLQSTQLSNGSWSMYGEVGAISDTVAVLDALNTLGLTADESYAKGVAWLGSQFPDSTLLASQKFWILARSGEDVSYSFESILQRGNDSDGGFGYERKYGSDVSTTATVLETITASNYRGYGDNPDAIKTSAVMFLLNSQNPNGGWGKTIGDESRVITTGITLRALFPYYRSILQNQNTRTAIKDHIIRGLAYLKNTQATDGSWNENLLDTALAYDSLHYYSVQLADEDTAFQYLQKAQKPDGSFGNKNPYVTANVLKALSYRLPKK